MAVTVVPRRNLEDNHAAVAAFARSLSEAFADWARQPMSATLPSLSVRLQGLAESQFEDAYLRGKRQALPRADLDANDLGFIRGKLSANSSYIKQSLVPDIMDKLRRQQLDGGEDAVKVVTVAFALRIKNLFGGQLWHMQEAGFASGVKALGEIVRRLPRPLAQETLLARVARLTKEREDSLLATQDTIERDRPTVEAWDAQQAAEIAAREAEADALPAQLGMAFNLPLSDIIDTLTQPGFRTGTKYNCEKDAASCEPCIGNAEGGEDGDGIYWEPDTPPFPGEDCDGYGNCRCTLETVYGS